MDQERVGKIIKKIRDDNKLTQAELASELGVTFQAVSKWENGKNIPDISILKLICEKYNMDLNDIIGTKTQKGMQKKYLVLASLVLFVVIGSLILSVNLLNKDDFHFKTISSQCENFDIYGSIAYNKNKMAMYISHIDYCGEEDDNLYNKIECSLYEKDDHEPRKIDECVYEYDSAKNIDEILRDVNFNIDDYSKTCELYSGRSLYLEINATGVDGSFNSFSVPLGFQSSCDE